MRIISCHLYFKELWNKNIILSKLMWDKKKFLLFCSTFFTYSYSEADPHVLIVGQLTPFKFIKLFFLYIKC